MIKMSSPFLSIKFASPFLPTNFIKRVPVSRCPCVKDISKKNECVIQQMNIKEKHNKFIPLY